MAVAWRTRQRRPLAVTSAGRAVTVRGPKSTRLAPTTMTSSFGGAAATPVAGAAASAASEAERRSGRSLRLADTEDDPVAAGDAHGVAVARAVARGHVEDVAPARETVGEPQRPRGARRPREPRAVP